MKKKLKIIIAVLFTISAIFIGTGSLVVDTTFYVTNNTSENMLILCKTDDGRGFEHVVEPKEKVLVFQVKELKFKNIPNDFVNRVTSIAIVQKGDTLWIESPEWKNEGEKRKNVFNYIVE
ncbi:MAG: hypothetical protein JXR36_01840 [Bacteroidales bacterium]|nr:hypothetical protein [Bacteroidales bacterium]